MHKNEAAKRLFRQSMCKSHRIRCSKQQNKIQYILLAQVKCNARYLEFIPLKVQNEIFDML